MPTRTIACCLGLLIAASAPAAAKETVTVGLDQAVVIKLNRPASDVVIGNPAIANAAVLSPTTIVLTGRAFGLTNVIFLDDRGNTIQQQDVAVNAVADGRVTVVRRDPNGKPFMVTQTYDCHDSCSAIAVPGDAGFGTLQGDAATWLSAAKTASGASASSSAGDSTTNAAATAAADMSQLH